MRVVVMVVAALLTLGLAAFGVVAAQNGRIGLAPSVGAAATIVSPAQPHRRTRARRRSPSQSPRLSTTSPRPAGTCRICSVSDTRRAAAGRTADAPPHCRAECARRLARPAPPLRPPAAAAPSRQRPFRPATIPNALGLSRIVEIDTTGGPAFGTEHFKQYDFLRDKEVVLTFDDGPWPENTPMVLKALTDNCTKATFFEIGEHATWHPEITRMLVAAGMTVGSHTWSHKDLAQKPLRQGYRAGQGRNRDGRQRRAHGGRRADRTVFPFPRSAAAAGDASPISASATSRRSRPTSTRSTSRSTSPMT